MRKFYRTLITVEILSEDNPVEDYNLDQIHYAITDGECSGEIKVTSSEEVTSQEMVVYTLAQGSHPGFFGLDEKGNDVLDQDYGLNLPVENKHVYFDDLNVPGLGLGVVKNGK